MSSIAIENTQPMMERWTVDPQRTTVEFEVNHFWGLHTVHGRFDRFEGSYTVGPAGPQIDLAIDAASVDTGNAARDKHLRAEDYFDVAEYPQMRFSSTRVRPTGIGRVQVSGTLSAAGASVPVDFEATVRLVDGELEVEATTTVDQSQFGMISGPLWNVRRPVKLHVKARVVPEPPA